MKPSELDLARAKYYETCPEIISEFEEWETLHFCKRCEGALDRWGSYMYPTRNGFNERVHDDHNRKFGSEGDKVTFGLVCCPHCRATNKLIYWKKNLAEKGQEENYRPLSCVYRSEPIEFSTVFRRKVWITKRERKLFRWVGRDNWFWEFKEKVVENKET